MVGRPLPTYIGWDHDDGDVRSNKIITMPVYNYVAIFMLTFYASAKEIILILVVKRSA